MASQSASQSNAFLKITNTNRGAIVTLVSVAFLIAAILFVAAKLGSVLYFKQRRRTVNTPIWIATILVIVQVVIVQKAVDYGLGRHADKVTAADLQKATKLTFAANLIATVVLCLSMLSTTLLIWILTPIKRIRLACNVTVGLIAVWTLLAIFGTAFQCQMPEPWLYSPDRCIERGAILYAIGVLHILIEIVIVVLPFFMMKNVQMAKNKRIKILSSFSARLLVVGLEIARVTLLPGYLQSNDSTWDVLYPMVCQQAMINVTVTIACFPTLYHIFAGLHSGLITTQIPDRVELSRPKGGRYINQSSLVSGSNDRDAGRGRKHGRTPFYGDADACVVTDITTSGYHHGGTRRRSSGSEDAESMKHLTHESRRDGVMKTVDITVEVAKDHLADSDSTH